MVQRSVPGDAGHEISDCGSLVLLEEVLAWEAVDRVNARSAAGCLAVDVDLQGRIPRAPDDLHRVAVAGEDGAVEVALDGRALVTVADAAHDACVIG